jgi:hypothetical protein
MQQPIKETFHQSKQRLVLSKIPLPSTGKKHQIFEISLADDIEVEEPAHQLSNHQERNPYNTCRPPYVHEIENQVAMGGILRISQANESDYSKNGSPKSLSIESNSAPNFSVLPDQVAEGCLGKGLVGGIEMLDLESSSRTPLWLECDGSHQSACKCASKSNGLVAHDDQGYAAFPVDFDSLDWLCHASDHAEQVPHGSIIVVIIVY